MKHLKGQLRLFFYWINERESIRLRKESGEGWPWTKDEILRTYKFTNVFRRQDRTTRDLIASMKKVWWGKNEAHTLVAHICLFRLFNWTPTYRLIGSHAGRWRKVRELLKSAREKGAQLWTGAYMIHADPGAERDKADSYIDTAVSIWKDRWDLAEAMQQRNTLEYVTEAMQAYNHIGAFVAYELACDFGYFPSLLRGALDKMTWANTGPGAARGIHRIMTGKHEKPEGAKIDYVAYMRWLLSVSEARRADYVKPLEMRDIEHSLCEFDKYCRVHFNEGRSPKQKYQQKEPPPWNDEQ